MRSAFLAFMVVAICSASSATTDGADFILVDRSIDLADSSVAVSAQMAFETACHYGLDPEVGAISVELESDEYFGLHWEVGYVDWHRVSGTSGFFIDAQSGVVVERVVTGSSHSSLERDFAVDPVEAQVDTCPPAAPIVAFAGAERGHHPQRKCVLPVEVEIAKRGVIEAYVLHLADDRTPREDIGIVVESLGGEFPLPDDWKPQGPFYPRVKFHPDSLMLFITWDDGDDKIQEPVSNSFAIFAVDKAGNKSTVADTLVVELAGG